ncbi:MAG: diguanylate cyclase, partial [Gammaproteobacteria bacterium]|nr:diguanylate cyclase [Gammaproteobacteria bacterium]
MNPLPTIERQAFLGSLSRYINTETERQGTLGLLLIDAIGFAEINHNHGFAFGDQILQHSFSR